jgi:hypothetical protein
MSYQSTNVHPIASTVPPKGDEQKGEKYISDLVRLIEQGKVQVHKTDLSQFNPSSLQNHYRLDLDEFQIEISHSSHLDTGANSYVIIFNNLKNIADGNTEKAILAYIHLNEEQYRRFHQIAEDQIEKLRKIEDEKKFIEAVKPLDNILANLEQSNKDIFSEKLAEVRHHNQEVQQEIVPETEVQEEVSSTNTEELASTTSTDPWGEPHTITHEDNETNQNQAQEYQQPQQYTLGTQPTTY